jgi:dienelactone hydrolase
MIFMRRLFFALALPSLLLGDELPPLRGLSRSNLLEYPAADGTTKIAQTAKEWEARRKAALAGFQQVAGPLPGSGMRCALDPQTLEETDCGSYVRRLITYASQPGGRVPAYLCIPKTALQGAKTPAVLCLHPTENTIGHKVVVGLGGKPHRQYAAELAERGFVTLAPSYPLLADYQPDLKSLQMPSGTMKAVWDNLRGLDFLESLPFVDTSRGFAAIGHSLGGHNAIFTAVFDDRIRVIVSSCGFDSFLDYKGGNIQGWNQERYMSKMGDYIGRPQDVPFDFYELIACLAPRHVYVNAPLRDSNFSWQSVDRIAATALPVFRLQQAGAHLQIAHPDSDHDFPDPERLASYEVILRVLRPAEGSAPAESR